MNTVGRRVLSTVTGAPVEVIAIPEGVDWKAVGITLDWSTVAAVSGADVTYPDKNVVRIGKKGLRFGQILCKITQAEITTVDVSGDDDPTGGDFDLRIAGTAFGGETFSEDLEGVAWNVSAADLQTAIRALDFPGAELVTVSKALFVYTITFPPESGNVTVTSPANALTGGGGDTFAVTVGTTTQGVTNSGKYGPYDPAANDGRQTLSRGNCFILNQTILQDGGAGDLVAEQNHPPVFDGGQVWKARLIVTSGTHSLAVGPTWTEFEAAFPRVGYVNS